MKRQHIRSIALGLIFALTASPLVMAEEVTKAGDAQRARAPQHPAAATQRISLSSEQMDGVHGGRINLCEPDLCARPAPPDPGHGAGCNQCPVIWNSGVDGPIIIWDRSGR